MELFKFSDGVASPFQGGQPISGYKSVRWTERYQEAGDFEITSLLSAGLRSFLPLGSRISHVDTGEVMMVENHNVVDNRGEEPSLKISGRGITGFFENRFVGQNLGYNDPAPPLDEYTLAAGTQGDQLASLISTHTYDMTDPSDELPNLTVSVVNAGVSVVAQVIKRQNLYDALIELLQQYDFGVKTRRDPTTNGLTILVHNGIDHSNDVVFTWSIGDISESEYLFTNRNLKNTAYVVGRYVEEFVYTGASGWDRRVMMVDGTDLDQSETVIPSGATLTAIRQKMYARGELALMSQNDLSLIQVTTSANSKYRYKRDYDIGDIVAIRGSIAVLEKRRIAEYTFIEDENGDSGHPTLSAFVP